MRLCHSSILIITCIGCLGFYPSPAHNVSHISKFAQASSINLANQPTLRPGNTGAKVKELQTQLKNLGYYDGIIDGRYGENLTRAVSRYQAAKGLKIDGIVGQNTWKSLQQANKVQETAPAKSNTFIASPPEVKVKPQGESEGILWWFFIFVGILGCMGAILYFVGGSSKGKKLVSPNTLDSIASSQEQLEQRTPPKLDHTGDLLANDVTLETTSRLAKINIVEELIKDLHSSDSTKRRKAIWDLGQQGDSRAIQPLVDLMIDADSQQRSLILAALAEIGTRTLKPMNRALAISLQDESPQVRQNAIRDLTRVYDMMAQISQMLCHAVEDPDTEVQATARYALAQMNRIRALASSEEQSDKLQADTSESHPE